MSTVRALLTTIFSIFFRSGNIRAGLFSVGILSAGLVNSVASVHAADFGADCCADLERRIAELEATTARKGNRKVSLKISGHINEAVMWWDDGKSSNVYVVTNDTGRSRLRFRGKAKINSEWEAGYRLEIGFRVARSDRVNQNTANPAGEKIDLRYSAWYLKSKIWGEVQVGNTDTSGQGITESNVTQTASIAKNSDVEDHIAGFLLRTNGAPGLSDLQWRRLINDTGVQAGDSARTQTVHYISPSLAGFHLHAAWGADDYWDVGLAFKGTVGDVKLKAGIAYGKTNDEIGGPLHCIESDAPVDCHQLGGSFSALHQPTGLFLTFGAGWYEDKNINRQGFDGDATFYALQFGLEKNWVSLGKTTIYGEYFKHDGGYNDRNVAAGDAINPTGVQVQINDSEVETIGFGVIQGIDAAAMRVYLIYRHYEADLNLNNAGVVSSARTIEDVDVVVGGTIIQF